jgi:hypothetical protein
MLEWELAFSVHWKRGVFAERIIRRFLVPQHWTAPKTGPTLELSKSFLDLLRDGNFGYFEAHGAVSIRLVYNDDET